ncbi:MAG: GNAT family N-acetyltransferase [Verrucomicrobiae bacterium]|nr:GNAT family N-acetyltransferase [Verrucomicrobiae bacterium]
MKKRSPKLPRERYAKLKRSLSPKLRVVGRRVYLRPLTRADATPRYAAWLNDPEVNRFTESKYTRHTVATVRDYIESANRSASNFFFAIVERGTDRHVGNIKIDSTVNPHWDHLVGEVGLIIGEKDCWGRGYGSEAIELITRFAFDRLDLHKLTATCLAINPGSAHAFLKAGYTQEAVRPSNGVFEGKYVDLLLFGVINPKHLKTKRRHA